jgi:mycothiol synthase
MRGSYTVTPLPSEPVGLCWRHLTRPDLADLDALISAAEDADDPSSRHSLAELQEAFDSRVADPGRDAVVGRDADGTLVAYGWNHPHTADTSPRRVHLAGTVHPAWRGRGIGRAVLGWQLARAQEFHAETRRPGHGPLQVIAYADEKQTAQRSLYEHHGLKPTRWLADMFLTFSGPPPPAVAPAGIRLVPLSHKLLEPVRVVHNEAFADRWGAQPIDAVSWDEQLNRRGSRLSWSWVALAAATSEVVGYVTNAAYEQDWEAQGFSEGWTDRLGVRRCWRGRGVASALLRRSMQSFYEAGLDAAGIGIDSDGPSDPFGRYLRLGYRVVNLVLLHARTFEDTAGTTGEPSGADRTSRRPPGDLQGDLLSGDLLSGDRLPE